MSNASDEDLSHSSNQAVPNTLHLDTAEERMRRALGLSNRNPPQQEAACAPAIHSPQLPQPGRPRHHLSNGRDVAVTIIRRKRHAEAADRQLAPVPAVNRLEATETALKAERLAREQAERGLSEAQAKIRELQTKIVHADLAHQEALAAALAREASARQALQELRDSLCEIEQARQAAVSRARRERVAREQAEEALEAERRIRESVERKLERAVRKTALAPIVKRARPASGRAKKTQRTAIASKPKIGAGKDVRNSSGAKAGRATVAIKSVRKAAPAKTAASRPVRRVSSPRAGSGLATWKSKPRR